MLNNAPFMTKGIIAFLVPALLGVLAYVVATLVAHLSSSVARHAYVNRLICLVILFVFICLLWPAEAFSGSRERYFRSGQEAKSLGTSYGMGTWLIWFILALLKRPKKTRDDNAA
jgi:hypothetical protein